MQVLCVGPLRLLMSFLFSWFAAGALLLFLSWPFCFVQIIWDNPISIVRAVATKETKSSKATRQTNKPESAAIALR